jgi:CHC2 zinc finger
MRGIDFAEARARLRIAEVLELMGYEPRRLVGQQARGPCPLHGSRSPGSRVFAVHGHKNVFHCFACGAGGTSRGCLFPREQGDELCLILEASKPTMSGSWTDR